MIVLKIVSQLEGGSCRKCMFWHHPHLSRNKLDTIVQNFWLLPLLQPLIQLALWVLKEQLMQEYLNKTHMKNSQADMKS